MPRSYTQGYVVKDKGTWRAIVNWQDVSGKQRRLTKSTGIKCYPNKGDNRNKAHAEEFLREWRDGLVAQSSEEDEAPRATTPLTEYCEGFLALHSVKASTRSGYAAAITKLRGTSLGNKPLCDVTTDDVRIWENGMREDGLSETTIAHYHAFVAQVFKAATIEGKVRRNPVAAMKAPHRRPKPVNSLTAAQRREVLDRLDAMGATPFTTAVRMSPSCRLRALSCGNAVTGLPGSQGPECAFLILLRSAFYCCVPPRCAELIPGLQFRGADGHGRRARRSRRMSRWFRENS